MSKGILYGIGAYVCWGFFPIYWKSLRQVPATQLIGHRILWSFLLLFVVILFSRQWGEFRKTINFKVIRIYSIAAVLIGINWLVYVWAVNANYIVETSLGYFINPLLSVLLGVIFLKERLRIAQWIPVILASIGVAYLSYVYGRLPYIALTLSVSFGLYGLVKKISPLGSLHGLTIETGILCLPALVYLIFVKSNGTGAFLALRTHLRLSDDWRRACNYNPTAHVCNCGAFNSIVGCGLASIYCADTSIYDRCFYLQGTI